MARMQARGAKVSAIRANNGWKSQRPGRSAGWQNLAIMWQDLAILWQNLATLWQRFAITENRSRQPPPVSTKARFAGGVLIWFSTAYLHASYSIPNSNIAANSSSFTFPHWGQSGWPPLHLGCKDAVHACRPPWSDLAKNPHNADTGPTFLFRYRLGSRYLVLNSTRDPATAISNLSGCEGAS